MLVKMYFRVNTFYIMKYILYILSLIFRNCFIMVRVTDPESIMGTQSVRLEFSLDGNSIVGYNVHTFTLIWGNLELVIELPTCCREVGGNQRNWGPCSCEVAVLPAAPPSLCGSRPCSGEGDCVLSKPPRRATLVNRSGGDQRKSNPKAPYERYKKDCQY